MSNNISSTVKIERHVQHARKMHFNISAAPGSAHLGLQGARN